jgi:hypothetical protein
MKLCLNNILYLHLKCKFLWISYNDLDNEINSTSKTHSNHLLCANRLAPNNINTNKVTPINTCTHKLRGCQFDSMFDLWLNLCVLNFES